MPSTLERTLMSALEQIEVIDAHEHLSPEYVRTSLPVDVFTFFSCYVAGDLMSAGMSEADFRIVGNHDIPIDRRWKVAAPFWERIRWGSYARALLLTLQKFYGADDLNEKTAADISEKMAAANTPGIYQRVLRDACNIRTSLTQCGRTDVEKPLLTPVMGLTGEMGTWEQVTSPTRTDWQGNRIPFAPGITVRTLDDLLDANRSYILQVKSEGAVGLKMASNPFKDPSRQAADETFGELRRGAVASLPQVNPLRDYVVDEMIRFAGEQDLPVAVHTGYWGDFRTLDPLHMIPIVQRHPKVHFDFYHLGYPWVRESIMLAKGFPNIWLNFCWAHIISQFCVTAVLDEVIDTVPMNKVLAFGADYVEGYDNEAQGFEQVYGHLVMARENIARVLARRIESGQMTEDQALGIARRWLFDNANELYHLGL